MRALSGYAWDSMLLPRPPLLISFLAQGPVNVRRVDRADRVLGRPGVYSFSPEKWLDPVVSAL